MSTCQECFILPSSTLCGSGSSVFLHIHTSNKPYVHSFERTKPSFLHQFLFIPCIVIASTLPPAIGALLRYRGPSSSGRLFYCRSFQNAFLISRKYRVKHPHSLIELMSIIRPISPPLPLPSLSLATRSPSTTHRRQIVLRRRRLPASKCLELKTSY